ncbi:type II secretion system protein [bacterium]|nr:type II secretion system protein [bacterium]
MKNLNLRGWGLLEDNKISNFNKFPQKYKNIKKKAFSIAEALITLAIVGIAVGSAAPLISKTMKNSQLSNFQLQYLQKQIDDLKTKNIQSGAIMFFNNSDCPDGWSLLTANDGSSLDGYYIRLTTSTGDVGKKLNPSLPNIKGGFPGLGQFFYASTDASKPASYFDEDKNERDLGLGKQRPNDGLFGAMYRINTSDAPSYGVRTDNDEGSQRDDYFGFNANYSNPIYGAADDSSTTDVDESANEVRPKSIMLIPCRKN